MFSLKIKQAQFALNQCRLDDAFETLNDKQLLEHRQGKRLAGKLANRFVERANRHLEKEMIEQALADVNKAARMAGNTVEVCSVRKAVAEAINQKHFARQQQQENFAAAKDNIRAGWYSVAADMLKGEQTDQGAVLLQNADALKAKTKAVIEKARKALENGYEEEAIEIVRRGQCMTDIGLLSSGIIAEIRRQVCSKVRDDLDIGRIDLAENRLKTLGTIQAGSLESQELENIVAECRTACGYIATGQLSNAAMLFAKLKIAMPKAKWINEAANDAAKGAKAIEELKAGPLGLIRSRYSHNAEKTEHDTTTKSLDKPKRNVTMTSKMQSKFMLHIDGTGSYIVIKDDAVTVGPVSSDQNCDVKIVAAADTPVTTFERTEGDYFFKSERPVGINNKQTTGCLLRDGDKIALSNRNTVKFRKANSASNTAEIIPTGARLIQAGVTGVILMDNEILIGAGGSNHIRTDEVKDGAMLYFKDGCLMCKSTEIIEIDGKICGGQCVIEPDKQVRIGGMTLVITSENPEH